MKCSIVLFAVFLLLFCFPGVVPNIHVATCLTTSTNVALSASTVSTASTLHFAGMNLTISPSGEAMAYNYFSDCCGSGGQTSGFCCTFYFYGVQQGWWND